MSFIEHAEECLRRVAEQPEAAAVALLTRRDGALLDDARAADSNGDARPLAGQVLSVKACFDVAGWTTHCGSSVRADDPPAAADAAAVTALRSAGALLFAQTNMTEFAYGALGLNDTYGTPSTPLIPGDEHVSGGSTSGGAVAVARGFADIALGSDTSGSIRIPAAFCGVAGFKPTKGRYPETGMAYLSPTFDVPGIIATSAEACRRVHVALGFMPPSLGAEISPREAEIIVPGHTATDGVDPQIAAAFAEWLQAISDAGASIRRREIPSLAAASAATRDGGIIGAEAFAQHRSRLADEIDRYDPRVGPRIAAGELVPAWRYSDALRRIRVAAAEFERDMADAAVIVTPTTPMLPPRIDAFADNDHYLATNAESFRLTEFANRLDLPSITIPGDLGTRRPFGLLITGRHGEDARVLDIAVAIERWLTG